MCGIVGVLSTKERVDQNTVSNMRDRMIHRGPDDAGLYASPDGRVVLGHRRLSIIDLSERGRQPLSNEDGTIWVTFNGEIYNFQVLKKELEQLGHNFRSNTDTEVIVHAYEAWGEQCVNHFNGMFAFGLWDERQKKLMLARDPIGIKPLFYFWDGSLFIFASEIKALINYPGISREFDRAALFDYFTYGYIPTPATAYRHIKKMKEGCRLLLVDSAIQETQYWDVSFSDSSAITDENSAVTLVQQKLSNAVSAQMISDVPVGVLLSGGIDSSAITALASAKNKNILHTCSVGFDVAEFSETAYARQVAQHLGTTHHEATVGWQAVQTMLPNIIERYDEPFADSSALPTYEVCRIARQHVTVALSGDGGDEVFGGYRWYDAWLRRHRWQRIPTWIRTPLFYFLALIWPSFLRGHALVNDLVANDDLVPYASLLQFFSPEEKRKLFHHGQLEEFRDRDDFWYFRQHWHRELDPLTRVQYLDLKTYLPADILTKVDRASMAVSLEVRPPLLDHELVQLLFNVPAGMRRRNGEKKYLLKRALRKELPAVILERSKKGFSVPWHIWNKDIEIWAHDFLLQGQCIKQGLLNRQTLEKMMPHLSGSKLWLLLVLEQWLQTEICTSKPARPYESNNRGFEKK